MSDRKDELHLNDPAHTATRGATPPGGRANTEDATLESDETKSKAAAGAATGLGGAAAGAAGGMVVGGPIGAAIGGLAGALGGWWVGHASVAANEWSDEHDTHYRGHYEALPDRPADRSYEHARPAYQLGYLAHRNPEWKERRFDEVEGHLRQGWTADMRSRHGEWEANREHVRAGYERPWSSTVSDRPEGRVGDRAGGKRAGSGDGLRSDPTTGY